VILLDSQPSGDPTPSKADIDLTREIEKVLKAPEIRLHDHLAVGPSETVSLNTKGLI
jgi:DNA repair protein RadC